MKSEVDFLVLKDRYICPDCGAELQPQLTTGRLEKGFMGVARMIFLHEYRTGCERSGHKFSIVIRRTTAEVV